MQGEYQAGPSFCEGVAKALDVPLETVRIEAGLIHGSAEIPPEVREWASRLNALSEDQRRRTVVVMENILRLSEGREPRQ